MTDNITVRFDSAALDSPDYVGPFDSLEAAQDYADDGNNRLAEIGVPSSFASYSVVN